MGAAPDDCLVIEDSVAGVTAARAAGMKVFGFVGGSHFSGPAQAAELTAAGADLIFDDMARLPEIVAACASRSAEGAARGIDGAKGGSRRTETRRSRARGLALLCRRQHAGRDRAQARHLAPSGAAARLARHQRAPDQGQARSSDCALHGARRGVETPLTTFASATSRRPIRTSTSSTLGIAQVAAAEFERWLRRPEPAIIGIGTGRTMRAVADQLPAMECPQHKLVALVGTTKTDGSASFYDVIIRVSDSVRAPHYPMPLPVIARSVEERELFTSLASVKSLFDLVERTDVSFVGVGSVGDSAPLVQDGIITRQEAEALRQLGAVGEITGWAFDAAGRVLTEGTNLQGRRGSPAQGGQPAGDRRGDGAVAPGAPAGGADRRPLVRPRHRRGDGGAPAAALSGQPRNRGSPLKPFAAGGASAPMLQLMLQWTAAQPHVEASSDAKSGFTAGLASGLNVSRGLDPRLGSPAKTSPRSPLFPPPRPIRRRRFRARRRSACCRGEPKRNRKTIIVS